MSFAANTGPKKNNPTPVHLGSQADDGSALRKRARPMVCGGGGQRLTKAEESAEKDKTADNGVTGNSPQQQVGFMEIYGDTSLNLNDSQREGVLSYDIKKKSKLRSAASIHNIAQPFQYSHMLYSRADILSLLS